MTTFDAFVDDGERPEIIIVARPVDAPPPASASQVLREVLSHTVGLAVYTVSTSVSLARQAAGATVEAAIQTTAQVAARGAHAIADPVLDAVVPRATDAILDRIDLTTLVLERVDINRLVAAADIEAVIDRVPIVPIANYVIDEIDLPQIIRASTGGVAVDAVNAVRVQTFGADQWVAGIVDAIVRRRQRDVDAPGDPQSLSGQAASGEASGTAASGA